MNKRQLTPEKAATYRQITAVAGWMKGKSNYSLQIVDIFTPYRGCGPQPAASHL